MGDANQRQRVKQRVSSAALALANNLDAAVRPRHEEAVVGALQSAPMTEGMLRRSLGHDLFDRIAVDVLGRALPAAVSAAALSLPEKVAVHLWTLDTSGEPWFARINAMMRMVDVTPAEFEAVMPVAHALMSALRKLPPLVGTVYRGIKERPIGPDAFEQFVREHESEERVYHPGFVGCSKLESGALRGKSRLIISSITGRDISSLSAKPDQQEVLFLPPLYLQPDRSERRGGVVRTWASETS